MATVPTSISPLSGHDRIGVWPGLEERPFQCQVVLARPEGQQSASEDAYQYSVVTTRPAPMLATVMNGMCAAERGRYGGVSVPSECSLPRRR